MIATVNEWRNYLNVQMEGKYNMLSKQAIEATGLSEEVYKDILYNYVAYSMCEDGYRQVYQEIKTNWDNILSDVEDTYWETHCYSY